MLYAQPPFHQGQIIILGGFGAPRGPQQGGERPTPLQPDRPRHSRIRVPQDVDTGGAQIAQPLHTRTGQRKPPTGPRHVQILGTIPPQSHTSRRNRHHQIKCASCQKSLLPCPAPAASHSHPPCGVGSQTNDRCPATGRRRRACALGSNPTRTRVHPAGPAASYYTSCMHRAGMLPLVTHWHLPLTAPPHRQPLLTPMYKGLLPDAARHVSSRQLRWATLMHGMRRRAAHGTRQRAERCRRPNPQVQTGASG
jgi:hypothetical protein